MARTADSGQKSVAPWQNRIVRHAEMPIATPADTAMEGRAHMRVKQKVTPWQNRIIRHDQMAVEHLQAAINPRNWRTHPEAQRQALAGVLGEVGLVQGVIFNQRTGYLVDGHARVEEAARVGMMTLPVTVVDLSEAEEALVLATLDPVAALAGADAGALDALLREVETSDAAVQQLLADLAEKAGVVPETPPATKEQGGRWDRFELVVECADEADQQALYDRLTTEGRSCRLLSM